MYVVNLVDTGVFRGLGKPPNEKYEQVKRAVEQAGETLCLPQPIYEELGGETSAETYPYESDYVSEGIQEGWIDVATTKCQSAPAKAAKADATAFIAEHSNHPKTAVTAEDAAIIGYAVQLFEDNETIFVNIHTTDKPVANAAIQIIPEFGYYDVQAYFDPPQRVHTSLADPTRFIAPREEV